MVKNEYSLIELELNKNIIKQACEVCCHMWRPAQHPKSLRNISFEEGEGGKYEEEACSGVVERTARCGYDFLLTPSSSLGAILSVSLLSDSVKKQIYDIITTLQCQAAD